MMFSVGENWMGQWQNKILFTLILYGAGFVTAVYLLTPDPAQAAEHAQASVWSQDATAEAGTHSHAWAVKIRAGIDTGIDFAEEYALRVADLIRAKMKQGVEGNAQSGQAALE